MIIVLVQLDLAIGNHTTKYPIETFTTVRFRDANRRRDPESLFDSETTGHWQEGAPAHATNVVEKNEGGHAEIQVVPVSAEIDV